ncbi:hypothetical protein OB2597_20306 [Pseudooceanicola batsensis HTCC2597]|uniref:Flagellar FliJ protein n=1 Tax=Pseudooceanicola batsensis (strain ATCC BAA-863 / DSM 15984 / KCTC 12145 / HTCC2597) TaxID=252305 RepID=A3U121_PSEBH|nr:hypothetical protein [Pseudooceanicola batsensis]EAQ02004.1 hypothetical protein OB2597_20306 [Pseudooceanicola batsensis HTCC2597]
MPAKRRRALSLMERMYGLDIDQVTRDMAELRRQMKTLKANREDLRERLTRERNVTSREAQPYVASFVDAVTRQMRRLEHKMLELEPELIKHETRLRDLYQQQKIYESVRLKDLRDEQAARQKREQGELEELTLLRWNR